MQLPEKDALWWVATAFLITGALMMTLVLGLLAAYVVATSDVVSDVDWYGARYGFVVDE